MYQTINPANGEVLGSHEWHGEEKVDGLLESARAAWAGWKATSIAERAVCMQAMAAKLREGSEALARVMALEMGKPLKEGRAEAEKCAWVCEYYAENAARFLMPEEVPGDADTSYIAFEPLGAVLATMPWNFPFWQVFRFAAPGLMAGNVVVLKHAPNVPQCAEAIERLFHEAGFPEGVLVSVRVDNERAEALIDDPRIAAVTLTGSTGAGRAVAARAGAALKKSVLELGGSDPYVLLDDADVDAAAAICVKSRLINGGQSCIAAKRFIVTERNRSRFEERVTRAMKEVLFGDPCDESSGIGPMAREDLRDAVHQQVVRSVEEGASCLLGGTVPDRPGFYYPPTVLTDVKPGMPAYEEEVFGPVAAIIPAYDEAEALRIANDSPFGLGAAVFTRDVERGRELAEHTIRAGCCFVNDFVKSDPRLPFGGIGQSGYGRELAGCGMREFVNIKTICIKRQAE